MLAASALLVCGASAGFGEASDADADVFRRLLEGLDSRVVECDPDLVSSLRDSVALACGIVTPELKAFRRAWERAAARVRSDGTEIVALTSRWSRWGRDRRARYLRVEGLPMLVLFSQQTGTVTLARYEIRSACRERARQTGVVHLREDALGAADTAPRLVRRIEPVFPERGRRAQLAGVVWLWYVVDTAGAVGRSCLVAASPHGHGFVEAAMEAVEQWGYEPAVVDGRTAAVEIMTEVTFERGPTPLPWADLLEPFFVDPSRRP